MVNIVTPEFDSSDVDEHIAYEWEQNIIENLNDTQFDLEWNETFEDIHDLDPLTLHTLQGMEEDNPLPELISDDELNSYYHDTDNEDFPEPPPLIRQNAIDHVRFYENNFPEQAVNIIHYYAPNNIIQ